MDCFFFKHQTMQVALLLGGGGGGGWGGQQQENPDGNGQPCQELEHTADWGGAWWTPVHGPVLLWVHNNYPVVEEQLAAGEDNEQDEDQEEPGLLSRAEAENDHDEGEEEIAEGAAVVPLNIEQLVGGVGKVQNKKN